MFWAYPAKLWSGVERGRRICCLEQIIAGSHETGGNRVLRWFLSGEGALSMENFIEHLFHFVATLYQLLLLEMYFHTAYKSPSLFNAPDPEGRRAGCFCVQVWLPCRGGWGSRDSSCAWGDGGLQMNQWWRNLLFVLVSRVGISVCGCLSWTTLDAIPDNVWSEICRLRLFKSFG